MANKRKSVYLNSPDYVFNKVDSILNIKITKDNLVDVLLSINEKDICDSFIMKIFGQFDGKVLCHPYDFIYVPKGVYEPVKGKSNKNVFCTTVGLWIYNIYFVAPHMFNLMGYMDKTINKKVSGQINQQQSYALIEDKINTEDLSDYLMKTQKVMTYETILTPNHSKELLCSSKKIEKKKAQLLIKYKDELNSTVGDTAAIAAEKMQNELLDFTMELLGDDPSLDGFISGAQGSIDNNFKNIYIMKGAVADPDPNAKKKFNIITSNYIDGISAEDYAVNANSLAAGPYARGKKTQSGGYWEKLFVSAFQHIILDPEGSDCKTDRYITVQLNKDNYKDYMYSYMISGNSLVELTSENYEKYLGKIVKFRFSSMCKSKTGICNKCAGNLWYRIGIKNIGIITPQIASKLKNICMKNFHDSSVRTSEMDPMKAFGLKR